MYQISILVPDEPRTFTPVILDQFVAWMGIEGFLVPQDKKR
jgi:hypothetical protein